MFVRQVAYVAYATRSKYVYELATFVKHSGETNRKEKPKKKKTVSQQTYKLMYVLPYNHTNKHTKVICCCCLNTIAATGVAAWYAKQ